MINKTNLLAFLLLFSLKINAQEVKSGDPFWLNFSFGGSCDYSNGSLSFNKSLENLSYQIALNGSTKSFLSNKGIMTGNIGIGTSTIFDWLIASMFAGPSISYGEDPINSYFWCAGLSLNVQAYFMPLHKLFPGLGLGVELYYNYNAMQTTSINYRQVYSIRVGVCLTNLHEK